MFSVGALARLYRCVLAPRVHRWRRAGLASLATLLGTSACAQLPAPIVTVQAASPHWETSPAGASYPLTLRFTLSAPTAGPQLLRLQALDLAGAVAFETTYTPTLPTTQWTGTVRIQVPVRLPATLPEGGYRLAVTLRPATSASPSTALRSGDRVTETGSDTRQYIVSQVVVTRRTIRTAALACDGRDETAAINAALAGLQPGETLKLPAGSCRFSQDLRLDHKQDVELVGAGRDDTVLLTSVPFKSAIVIAQSSKVLVRDLTVRLDRDFDRLAGGHSRGLYAEKSTDVRVLRTRHDNMAGAGIAYFVVKGGEIRDNEILDSRADGIHVTGGSTDILIDGNRAVNTGDDAFACIGYDNEAASLGLNQRVTISNNQSIGSAASGVAVEGCGQVLVSGNLIESSGVAGIRIASQQGEHATGPANDVVVRANTLRRVRQRPAVDHAAIMAYTDQRSAYKLEISGNLIESPGTVDAIRVRGAASSPTRSYSNVTIRDNTIRTPTGTRLNCVTKGVQVYNLVASGNTLNAQACPP